ncbi:MAG: hypothetical protein KA159_09515 [Halioglobus sp.]|nr:hypothetical protein [Halioglobus sp.]
MGATNIEKLRLAAEGLILNDAQKHILAHRLTRKLARKLQVSISVQEMLELIESAMRDMRSGIDVLVVSDDAYRDNRVVRRVQG